MLNRNSMKNEKINLIILSAKYLIYTSKYKKQKTIFEGFKKVLKQRKEIEHYNALSKDKLDYHNQKWGFLGTVLKQCNLYLQHNKTSFKIKCLLLSKMYIYCFRRKYIRSKP